MRVRLGDYIKEYSVKNKNNEDIPVYSVSNSLGFCKDYFGKEVASKNKTTYKIVPRGCFAYNPSRINVGSVDWQNEEERVIVSPLYNVFSVSPLLDQQYLLYYLKSNVTLARIKAVASGSVRDNLKLSMLYEFPIDLVSLDQQYKVVSILNAVQKIIDLYQKELSSLDELVRARFVEMFGDPVDNPMNWEKKKLQDIVTEDCTISYGIVQTGENQKEGVPVFRPVDIVNHIPKVEELKKTTDLISNRYKKTLLKGHELLITVRANIADTFIVGDEYKGCNVGRGIVPIRTQENIMLLEFLKCLIDNKHLNDIIKSKAKGITLIQLNMEDLRNIELIIPPVDLQNDYLKCSKLIDKSRSRIQKSLEASQELFDSLMQEYFG